MSMDTEALKRLFRKAMEADPETLDTKSPPINGRSYSNRDLIDEVENETPLGIALLRVQRLIYEEIASESLTPS